MLCVFVPVVVIPDSSPLQRCGGPRGQFKTPAVEVIAHDSLQPWSRRGAVQHLQECLSVLGFDRISLDRHADWRNLALEIADDFDAIALRVDLQFLNLPISADSFVQPCLGNFARHHIFRGGKHAVYDTDRGGKCESVLTHREPAR
jgi:hypothetical protein